MLQKIDNLPDGVVGIEAHGIVTEDDYTTTLIPMIDRFRRRRERIRFLYRFAPDFSEMTPGAAWDELRLSLRHLQFFERCAVVADQDWIRNGTRLFASFMPCPVQAFTNAEMSQALAWLEAPVRETNVKTDLIADKGVLVIEPTGRLSAQDFDRMAAEVDPWIEQHHGLHGLVVHTRRFPGWENLGSFLRHMQFVRAHQKSISRLAVVGGGATLDILPKIASFFIKPEVKTFDYDQLDEATAWAAAHA